MRIDRERLPGKFVAEVEALTEIYLPQGKALGHMPQVPSEHTRAVF
jgi:hypothetical protein